MKVASKPVSPKDVLIWGVISPHFRVPPLWRSAHSYMGGRLTTFSRPTAMEESFSAPPPEATRNLLETY